MSDVRKCITFCRRLDLPALGVIENMSGFVCPSCGKRVNIFKAGGDRAMAEDMKVSFLGCIPIEPHLVEASYAGTSFLDRLADSEAARAFGAAVETIVASIEPEKNETKLSEGGS